MRPLAECQRSFAAAVLDADAPLPEGLTDPDGRPSLRRFAVYRNNVVASLAAALAEAYPVTVQLVGQEFFSAVARLYVTAHPPRSPVMLTYGAGFADFLQVFPPLADFPYIPDVARIERARVEAYHAAEATPLSAPALMLLDAASRAVTLHPSIRILRSAWPAGSIWQASVTPDMPDQVSDSPEDTLVARPAAEVIQHLLPDGAAPFLQALAEGRTLEQAAGSALDEAPGMNIAATVAFVFQAGLVTGWRP